MGIKESESIYVNLNFERDRPGPFEIRLYMRSDDSWVCILGAHDLVLESGSEYECPALAFADRCCIYEVPLMHSER